MSTARPELPYTHLIPRPSCGTRLLRGGRNVVDGVVCRAAHVPVLPAIPVSNC